MRVAPTFHALAEPAENAESSGLTLPRKVVSPIWGKKSAKLAPMLALAAMSDCSASRISGRRCNSELGKPTGISAGNGGRFVRDPRGTGPGFRPSRTLIWFSVVATWDSS